MEHRNRAVFLDRDGVLNRLLIERGPRENPLKAEEFDLLPRVKPALLALQNAHFLLIVITNQPNIAKGKSSWEDIAAIDQKLRSLLAPEVTIDKIYACYHHPDVAQVVIPEFLRDCDCRKPKPGLILQALQDYPIDLARSWLVGDADTDIAAGTSAGIPESHCILITREPDVTIHYPVVADLLSASKYILNN